VGEGGAAAFTVRDFVTIGMGRVHWSGA
jgi:hypothetical protein